MNLNANPTLGELSDIFRRCDDSAGHHVLWVDREGEVHLDVLPEGMLPANFERAFPSCFIRYETFVAFNGYVGPGAADDETFMTRLLRSMHEEWADNGNRGQSRYVDSY